MTAEEAIFRLKLFEHDAQRNSGMLISMSGRHIELAMAIEALEEVEQYRALGTVEELKEAKEKQIPKKPENWSIEEMFCPSCNKGLAVAEDTTYLFREVLPCHCEHCGQAIDWGEVDR